MKPNDKKIKKYTEILENIILTAEQLTHAIDNDNLNVDEELFIRSYIHSTKEIKNFIYNTVMENNISHYKVNLIREFKNSAEYIDECLDDLDSIYFRLPNNEEFKKIKELYG